MYGFPPKDGSPLFFGVDSNDPLEKTSKSSYTNVLVHALFAFAIVSNAEVHSS